LSIKIKYKKKENFKLRKPEHKPELQGNLNVTNQFPGEKQQSNSYDSTNRKPRRKQRFRDHEKYTCDKQEESEKGAKENGPEDGHKGRPPGRCYPLSKCKDTDVLGPRQTVCVSAPKETTEP